MLMLFHPHQKYGNIGHLQAAMTHICAYCPVATSSSLSNYDVIKGGSRVMQYKERLSPHKEVWVDGWLKHRTFKHETTVHVQC